MTFGDLFSGIGGFRLGLERAGHECKWACEIDPFCRRVYLKHWPDTKPFYEDIHDVEDAPKVDLLCGGFPCQPVSFAGKRKGQSDSRWLWPEFHRLITEVRPQYALLENVSGLLSKGFSDILADLAEIGYDAEWDCIPASAVGAPHRRDRVWIVAYAQSAKRQRVRPIEGGESNRPTNSSEDVADTASGRQSGSRQSIFGSGQAPEGKGEADNAFAERFPDQWSIEPNVGRVAHGVPNRVDRLKSLGNAVVPQVVEWIGRRL